MIRCLGLAVAFAAAGCSSYDQKLSADPIEVKGKVIGADGKPVKDVKLNLFPLEKGGQSFAKVGADGSFTAKVVPAKYMFTFEALDGKPAAFRAVPAKYQDTNSEHTIDYSTSTDATVTLDR